MARVMFYDTPDRCGSIINFSMKGGKNPSIKGGNNSSMRGDNSRTLPWSAALPSFRKLNWTLDGILRTERWWCGNNSYLPICPAVTSLACKAGKLGPVHELIRSGCCWRDNEAEQTETPQLVSIDSIAEHGSLRCHVVCN